MLMKNFFYRLFFCLNLFSLLAACASPGAPSASGGYWVPPSANTATLAVQPVVQTPSAPLQPLDPAATEASMANTSAVSTPAGPLPVEASPTALPPTETSEFRPPTLAAPSATPEIYTVDTAPILYYAQAADTLRVVAVRFGVKSEEIVSPDPLPQTGFINPGQLMIIPRKLTNTTSSQKLLPDSEIIDSPSAISFDAQTFAVQAGGYLGTFKEWHKSTGVKSGGDIVTRVALENAINPRLLVALLEYHSNWVYGQPQTAEQETYSMGHVDLSDQGLYNQLIWSVNQLSIGYYFYREGRLTEIKFKDGSRVRLAPDLNAGTAALQYYFAQLYDGVEWAQALDPQSGFPALHARMFGSPWERAQTVEPIYPPGTTQPPLILPFMRDWVWSYTGGPHGAWEREGAYAALDFAPGTTETGCNTSTTWATAAASGLVVRTGPGLVVIDLDGDGHEQTGWVLIYLHLAVDGRIALNTWVATGDPLGHPSCEGGFATGTHLHIARKFNGEWVQADGPLPFNLGGWVAQAGSEAYKGTLTRDGKTVTSCVCSNAASFVIRTANDP